MPSSSKHCLLIVDDEPNVCDSVHDLLRREFRVLKAHSANEGYKLMQEEEVHIVMSDQRMPQISGVELLTKLKSRYPGAIRMLFTGFADLESIVAAINQGHVFQFLKKPWQPEELETAVRQAELQLRQAKTRLLLLLGRTDLAQDIDVAGEMLRLSRMIVKARPNSAEARNNFVRLSLLRRVDEGTCFPLAEELQWPRSSNNDPDDKRSAAPTSKWLSPTRRWCRTAGIP